MSAPHTNLEKQRKRHWAPLLGIAAATLFGVLLIVYWIAEEVVEADPETPAGIESGTVNEPAQSAIPAEAIEPGAQPGETGSTVNPPTTRESPPLPNAPEELTTE
ncbi:hypothetical protein [Rhodobacter sp. 24-YEA-8]|uniref:hypothetical protein n=1 Tax=Rhodobacter sp. 24-YEA-8 TaxID=1884310 RepID=UPI00089B6D53|nr:hypothetical protein [Rhodobacter sp. 24-YEA-8]SED49900.1 hypothetical protein SAMN05519105_4131 [Rhodobacter sp. 24-YEA-8]